MTKTGTDLFQQLKRNRPLIHRKNGGYPVFFQLDFDEVGPYLKIVNSKGEEASPSHEFYNGATRDLLKSIEAVWERNRFRIDWERPSDRIYLADNEHLLWRLRHCDQFVNTAFQPIRFAEEEARLRLVIEEKNGIYSARALLSHGGERIENPILLNESHAFTGDTIHPIRPLSENYDQLRLFQTRILPGNFEKYLSLLFTYLGDISVRLDGYRVVEGEPRRTKPTLIFEKIDPENALHLRLGVSLGDFDPDFFEAYDVTRVAAVNDLEKRITVSDLLHEEIGSDIKTVEKLIKSHRRKLNNGAGYYAEDNLFIVEEGLARAFIGAELPRLMGRFAILGAEKLKSYKVRAVSPRLNLSLSHGIDFLEGDASLEIEGESIPLFSALNQYRKHAYITLGDGTQALVHQQYMDRLDRIFKKAKDGVKMSFFDLPAVEELIDEKTAEQSFAASREIFMGFNALPSSKYRYPDLEADLRPYQKQGYKWLRYLHQHRLGGCLADDMGLGKTLQAIALLAAVYPGEAKNSLVVMPKSLLFNWESEIARFAPQLSAAIHHGMDRDFSAALASDIVLTTYATLRNDIETIRKTPFHCVILDESQHIKNINAQTSKAVMLLTADQRLALSGTPIENHLGELYALFRFLNPTMFGSAEAFTRNYAAPIQKNNDKAALTELKKKIYPFILRRLKEDVLDDLPDKMEQTIYVDMSDEQRVFYEERRQFYQTAIHDQIARNGIAKSQFFILQALGELRQIAAIPEAKSEDAIRSPKRDALMAYIEELAANDHKVLVFANYLHALECIAGDLEAAGLEYLAMTGATRDRQGLVTRFQEDESVRVFLMTLKTGGLGLNLTAADYVFIFDPWWNKAAENQAIDRTHRIGQSKTVFAYKLITRSTIEEKILQLQEKKRELFDSLIASDGAAIKSLDEGDVDFILGA